jgi:hypothetical protein
MADPERTKTGVILHDWTETGMSWSSLDRGLDLARPDLTTVQEVETWRQHDRDYRGYPMPTYDLLIELGRPDAVKRWFSEIPSFYTKTGGFFSPLLFVHLYAITGFLEGTIYEIDNAESQGHSKADVAECMALAFLHAPSGHGFFGMRDAISSRMHAYRERETSVTYPDGWEPDPDFFRSGLDFSSTDCSPEEVQLLKEWYERVAGEVPGWVQFLGEYKPELMKTYRNRLENTLRVLPKQMMPWLLLSWETHRGFEVGIREAVLLCRGFGVTKPQAIDAIGWGMLYGGHGAMSNVYAAAGDVLEQDW